MPIKLQSPFLGLVLLAATSGTLCTQDQPNKQDLPAELAAIPRDAFAFVYLRPAELWQCTPVAKLRKLFPQESAQMLDSMGEDPRETESFIMVFPTPNSMNNWIPVFPSMWRDKEKAFDRNRVKLPPATLPPVKDGHPMANMLFIETTVKPFKPAQVIERVLGKTAVAHKQGKRTFYTPKVPDAFMSGAVHIVNDRSYLFSFSAEVMKKTLADLDGPRAANPFSAALELARQKRHMVLGLNARHPAAEEQRQQFMENMSSPFGRRDPFGWAMLPLLEMRSLAVAIDVGKDLRLRAEMEFADAKQADKAAGAIQDAVFLTRFLVGSVMHLENRHRFGREDEFRSGELFIAINLLLPQLEKGLRTAVIEQRQTTLKVEAQVPLDLDALQELDFRGDFAFFHVRVADIMRTESAVQLLKLFPRLERESPLRDLLELGLPLDNIETAELVMPSALTMLEGGRRRVRVESSRANDFTIESVNELPRKLKREDASHTIKFKNGKIEKVMVEPPSKGLEVTVDGAASSVKVIITAAKLPEKDAEFQIVIVGKGDSGKEKTFRLRLKMPEPGDDQSSVSFSAPFENDIEVLLDDPMIVKVTTVKPYERLKVIKGILGDAREEKYRDKTYFIGRSQRGNEDRVDRPGVHFVDERTLLIVTPWQAMPNVLSRPALFRANAGLAGAAESARKKHHLAVAVNFNEASALHIKREILSHWHERHGDPLEEGLVGALIALLDARTLVVGADIGKDVHVRADVGFANPQQAAARKIAAQDALELARLFILTAGWAEFRSAAQHMLRDERDSGPLVFGDTVLVPGERPVLMAERDLRPLFFAMAVLTQAKASVRKATVAQQGATVSLAAQGRFDLAVLDAQAMDDAAAFVKNDEPDRLVRKSAMNMRKLIEAMHAYHDVHGKFPSSGQLSWRVQILPYLDELALYQEFRQNEPWDSPHNIKLLPRMPKIFAAPGIKTKEPSATHYQMFTGPGTIFDAKRDLAKGEDGLAIVEAFAADAWTKPTDLVYDAKKPLPKLGGVFAHGFHVGFIGGNVRFIREPVNEAFIRSSMIIEKEGIR